MSQYAPPLGSLKHFRSFYRKLLSWSRRTQHSHPGETTTEVLETLEAQILSQ